MTIEIFSKMSYNVLRTMEKSTILLFFKILLEEKQ